RRRRKRRGRVPRACVRRRRRQQTGERQSIRVRERLSLHKMLVRGRPNASRRRPMRGGTVGRRDGRAAGRSLTRDKEDKLYLQRRDWRPALLSRPTADVRCALSNPSGSQGGIVTEEVTKFEKAVAEKHRNEFLSP